MNSLVYLQYGLLLGIGVRFGDPQVEEVAFTQHNLPPQNVLSLSFNSILKRHVGCTVGLCMSGCDCSPVLLAQWMILHFLSNPQASPRVPIEGVPGD